MNAWTVVKGPHSLEIHELLDNGHTSYVPLTIGGTALAFRAPKSGARRGCSPVWYDFSTEDVARFRLILAAPRLGVALRRIVDRLSAFNEQTACAPEFAAAVAALSEAGL